MNNRTVSMILAVVMLVVTGLVAIWYFFLKPGFDEQARVREMEINRVDLNRLADGTYRGHFSYARTDTDVELVVKRHVLRDFRVLRRGDTEYAALAEKGVLPAVLKAQSLQVDVVTGATTTSKALLKAAENALSAPPVKK